MFSCKFEYEKDWVMPANLSELCKAISEHYPESSFESLTVSLFSDKVEAIAEFSNVVDDAFLKEICMFIYSYKAETTNNSEMVASPAIEVNKALNISEISLAEKTALVEKLATL